MQYKLPPLPQQTKLLLGGYDADQMRKYAEQAVAPLLAEIERLKEDRDFYKHEMNSRVVKE